MWLGTEKAVTLPKADNAHKKIQHQCVGLDSRLTIQRGKPRAGYRGILIIVMSKRDCKKPNWICGFMGDVWWATSGRGGVEISPSAAPEPARSPSSWGHKQRIGPACPPQWARLTRERGARLQPGPMLVPDWHWSQSYLNDRNGPKPPPIHPKPGSES